MISDWSSQCRPNAKPLSEKVCAVFHPKAVSSIDHACMAATPTGPMCFEIAPQSGHAEAANCPTPANENKFSPDGVSSSAVRRGCCAELDRARSSPLVAAFDRSQMRKPDRERPKAPLQRPPQAAAPNTKKRHRISTPPLHNKTILGKTETEQTKLSGRPRVAPHTSAPGFRH
jgi:hypothetical protein